MALVKDILRQLDLGSSVAEFDAELENYFVETHAFRTLIEGRADIVAGDKGTGKTALFRILNGRAAQLPELKGISVIPAFNPTGNPIFQRLTEGQALDESGYTAVWKTYIFALLGNWILEYVEADSKDAKLLDTILTSANLRSIDHTPTTIFGKIVDWVSKKLASTKSAQIAFEFSETGVPSVIPKLEFGAPLPSSSTIRYEEALGLINRIMTGARWTAWVVLDRLDEAFQGNPGVEIPALRALFRTYLDVVPFDRIRLKLFVRRDLFRKVTIGGFVNLTHLNARKIEISWDEEDLKDLLGRRVRQSGDFLSALGIAATPPDNNTILDMLFPTQVDTGERKSTTWSWMMTRIRDGNGVKPPRNLIDLVKKSQEAQIRKEEREHNEYTSDAPLIGSDSIKKGLAKLSEERVNDTLLAEVAEYASTIEKFRDGKAEHNDTSLAQLLNVPAPRCAEVAKALIEFGFLEQVGDSYKVPMLYREGLNITQGKAF